MDKIITIINKLTKEDIAFLCEAWDSGELDMEGGFFDKLMVLDSENRPEIYSDPFVMDEMEVDG